MGLARVATGHPAQPAHPGVGLVVLISLRGFGLHLFDVVLDRRADHEPLLEER